MHKIQIRDNIFEFMLEIRKGKRNVRMAKKREINKDI
jgi:hypothetical protein